MSILGQINRVKQVFNLELFTIVINALVFSKLFYCSSVWSSTSGKNIKKLQYIQNFAARIISGHGKYDHVTSILKELHWIPVKEHLYYRDAILTFKCMNGMVPEYMSLQFTTRVVNHMKYAVFAFFNSIGNYQILIALHRLAKIS